MYEPMTFDHPLFPLEFEKVADRYVSRPKPGWNDANEASFRMHLIGSLSEKRGEGGSRGLALIIDRYADLILKHGNDYEKAAISEIRERRRGWHF